MIRSEFINRPTDIDEIVSICNEYEQWDVIYDIFSDDEMNSYIEDFIEENIRRYGWRYMVNLLEDIPSGESYYKRWEGIDFSYIDDDIVDELKDKVIQFMDEGDLWEPEKEESSESTEEVAVDLSMLTAILA